MRHVHSFTLLNSVDKDNMAKLLIDKNASIDAVNDDGFSTLHLAATRGKSIFKKSDKRTRHSHFYSNLLQKGSVNVARVLLENGANVNFRSEQGILPIHWVTLLG